MASIGICSGAITDEGPGDPDRLPHCRGTRAAFCGRRRHSGRLRTAGSDCTRGGVRCTNRYVGSQPRPRPCRSRQMRTRTALRWHRSLTGRRAGRRRPLRYATVCGSRSTATRLTGSWRGRIRVGGVGHPRPASQRRPHTHTQSASAQPPIRSTRTMRRRKLWIRHCFFYHRACYHRHPLLVPVELVRRPRHHECSSLEP